MKPRLSQRFGKRPGASREPARGDYSAIKMLEEFHFIVFRIKLSPAVQFEYISPRLFDLIGYAREEFYANPSLPLQLVHPDDAFWLQALVFPAYHPISADPITLRVLSKSGPVIWLEMFIKPFFDPDGVLTALGGTIREISQQKEAELQAEENRILLSTVFGTALDAMIVLDEEFRICQFNIAAEGMFQVALSDVLGQPLDRFLPRNIGAWHEKKMREFGESPKLRQKMGQMRETSGIRSNGEEFPIETSLSVFEIAGKKFYTAIVRDITERKKAENELRHLSTHDPLTGLYNRLYFEEEMRRLDQGRVFPVSIMVADLDGLKYVNDSFGHHQGDQMIREVGQAIKNAFRSEDVVARIGGDEFGVLLPQADAEVTHNAIERIYSRLLAIAQVNPEIPFGLSIGLATSEANEPLVETQKRADQDMYRHKNSKAHRPYSRIG